MAKRSVSPIMTWIFWSVIVLGIFVTVTWDYFVAGFTADSSKITLIILLFFILGLWFSLRSALLLEKEFKSLQQMEAEQRVVDANESDVAAMFDAILERIRRGERIEVRNLVSAYSTKLKARIENVGVIANMLITTGLFGTVLGLIMTVTGLDTVLQSNSADYATMKAGLTRAVAGMGTAFYTTFFGALLGGVVLKVQGAEVRKAAALLVADTLRFAELFLAPQFEKRASESLVELEGCVGALHGQLERLGDSVGTAIDTIDAKQGALAAGLANLVEAVEAAGAKSHASAQGLADALARALDEANRLADERLGTLTSTIGQANELANSRAQAVAEAVGQALGETSRTASEQLGALVETGRSTVEETNRVADERLRALVDLSRSTIDQAGRQADDRLAALLERIGQVIDTLHQKADDRLGTLSAAIGKSTEETHRLADERLRALVKVVEESSRRIHEETDARLAQLVDSVGEAMELARNNAEHRLDAKAADIARKLSEAAGVLAALGQDGLGKEA